MQHRLAFAAAVAVASCNYVPSPETAFRAKTAPSDVEIAGDLAPGTHVRVAAVELEVVDVVAARKDDELVSPSVRAALEDTALASAAAATVAKAANERDVEKRATNVAERAAQAAAILSIVGSLGASSDEKSETVLRAKVAERAYRATCASTDQRAMLDVYARPSLSCAIVPVGPSPARHWALAIRTTTGGIAAPRHEGYVEARTAKGRDPAAPILRIYTADSIGSETGSDGKTEGFMQYNASFEIATPQGNVASVLTRSYGAKPQVWLDASSLADPEARDVAGVTAAILELYRWPEVDSRKKK